MTPDRDRDDRDGDDEDEHERLDRELIELLNEIRVALPGVQVLFAFLLTVPFTQRFTELSEGDRRVYFVAVMAAAVATTLLVAPTAHHRLRFRAGVKEDILRTANVLALTGIGALGVGMAAAVWVVSDFVYTSTVARAVTAALALFVAVAWFVVPFLFRPGRRPGRR